MAVGDIYQVQIQGTKNSQPVAITAQYKTLLSVGNKDLEMDSLLNAVQDNYLSQQLGDDLRAFCTIDTFFTRITCYDVINTQFGAEKVVNPPVQGVLAGEALANDQCMLILKSTGLRGRSRRGKNYLPVGSEATVNSGLWGPAFADAVIEWMDDATKQVTWAVNFVFDMVVWSNKFQYANLVTGFSYITEPRRQKRRRRVNS